VRAHQVDQAGLLAALALALDNEAVDAALQAVLVAREGLEAEAEQAFAVQVADGAREEVAQKGWAVVRVRVQVRVLLQRARERRGAQEPFEGRQGGGCRWLEP
jgi:hypothetical protein